MVCLHKLLPELIDCLNASKIRVAEVVIALVVNDEDFTDLVPWEKKQNNKKNPIN